MKGCRHFNRRKLEFLRSTDDIGVRTRGRRVGDLGGGGETLQRTGIPSAPTLSDSGQRHDRSTG
jgi:hypothetical protein